MDPVFGGFGFLYSVFYRIRPWFLNPCIWVLDLQKDPSANIRKQKSNVTMVKEEGENEKRQMKMIGKENEIPLFGTL